MIDTVPDLAWRLIIGALGLCLLVSLLPGGLWDALERRRQHRQRVARARAAHWQRRQANVIGPNIDALNDLVASNDRMLAANGYPQPPRPAIALRLPSPAEALLERDARQLLEADRLLLEQLIARATVPGSSRLDQSRWSMAELRFVRQTQVRLLDRNNRTAQAWVDAIRRKVLDGEPMKTPERAAAAPESGTIAQENETIAHDRGTDVHKSADSVHNAPPPVRTAQEAFELGEILRGQGYRLESRPARPGDWSHDGVAPIAPKLTTTERDTGALPTDGAGPIFDALIAREVEALRRGLEQAVDDALAHGVDGRRPAPPRENIIAQGPLKDIRTGRLVDRSDWTYDPTEGDDLRLRAAGKGPYRSDAADLRFKVEKVFGTAPQFVETFGTPADHFKVAAVIGARSAAAQLGLFGLGKPAPWYRRLWRWHLREWAETNRLVDRWLDHWFGPDDLQGDD